MLPESCRDSSMNLVMLQDTKFMQGHLLYRSTLTTKEQEEKTCKQSHLPLH